MARERSGIPETLAPLEVAVDELTPYERNPRQGDIGAIVTSLERNGQYRPIVVNRRGNVILAGNHTYWAARELGWKSIAATFVDVDDEAARRIVLVDNRSNDLAAYDEQALADLLKDIVEAEGADGLAGTGYDAEDLERLISTFEPSSLEDQGALDEPKRVTCPQCGHEFDPAA